MKVINIVRMNQEAALLLSKFGIKIEDFKYAQLYEDFHVLRDLNGEKFENAVATLAEQYSISRSKVIRLINKHDQSID